jgi:hypothetical protein
MRSGNAPSRRDVIRCLQRLETLSGLGAQISCDGESRPAKIYFLFIFLNAERDQARTGACATAIAATRLRSRRARTGPPPPCGAITAVTRGLNVSIGEGLQVESEQFAALAPTRDLREVRAMLP